MGQSTGTEEGKRMEDVILNERYRLVELVGSGGMAVVYRGVDTVLQREVAVKVLREGYASDPAFHARFEREAQAAAKLQHPNIVTVYDVGQDGDRHYIVMEYVHGQDLKTLIRQRGQLSVSEALDIAIQISSGAGHAHRMGFIHCDVKPQNVLVTEDGWAKVTDFGISRALSELDLTESETVWGSPIYFSPEQAAGEAPSPASDVYSIGVVMYEMLAGEPPFQADRSAALALMHLREEPPPLVSRNRQVPSQLEWIVRKVMAKEPAARYRTADQLAYVLDDYRAGSAQVTGMQPAAAQPAISMPDDLVGDQGAPTGGVVSSDVETRDWFATVLGAIAFVAVVGLIPLWVVVYRAYSAPSPTPVPPTQPAVTAPTQEANMQTVPDLEGRSASDATATLGSLGMGYVLEERTDPDLAEGTVVEQSPSAGEQVPAGSEIRLVVSSLGREMTMAKVVGYPLDAVLEGLGSDGLRVHTDRVWSAEQVGQVLAQRPGEGVPVRAGDVVTLAVSGGTTVPIRLGVELADLFTLESAQLGRASFRPGDDIALGLRWLPHRQTDVRYVVFVHLVGPDGRLTVQRDEEPSEPTSAWVPNRVVTDEYPVTIPSDAVAGTHQLRVGMYPSGQPAARLVVVDPGWTTVEANSILIVAIAIQP